MPKPTFSAIDEGTTSTRCMPSNAEQKVLSNVQFEFEQCFPEARLQVEHARTRSGKPPCARPRKP